VENLLKNLEKAVENLLICYNFILSITERRSKKYEDDFSAKEKAKQKRAWFQKKNENKTGKKCS
jgi:hypothetical protein